MNYWPVDLCNLSECAEPYFAHLKRMAETGKETARRMYGCRGFVAHHNTDIHADTAPQDMYVPATYWVMGGAWLATHIYEHYLFTNDREFLEDYYEVLREAVQFFLDFLTEDEEGYLVTNPSSSPENTYMLPTGECGRLCDGPGVEGGIQRAGTGTPPCLASVRCLSGIADHGGGYAGACVRGAQIIRTPAGTRRRTYGLEPGMDGSPLGSL